LVQGAEVQRTDLEGGVLVGGVGEQPQVDRHLGRAAAEEGGGAEGGRIHRHYLQAKHVPVEFGERDRVPRAEADVADTDHLRRFLLDHGRSFPFEVHSGMVILLAGGELRPARVRHPTLLIGNGKGSLRGPTATCRARAGTQASVATRYPFKILAASGCRAYLARMDKDPTWPPWIPVKK
jgi:hypothetical protein